MELSATIPPAEGTTSKAATGALFLLAMVSIAGFIALFVTINNLAHPGVDPKTLIAVTAFGGATVLGVVGLLVWLLLQLITGYRPAAPRNKSPKPFARDYRTPELPAAPVSMPSVTENTTRNFLPSPYGDKSERE
ncbi:MAG TPA: hypothetical protein VGL29_04155 [Blastocatellia bacterium]